VLYFALRVYDAGYLLCFAVEYYVTYYHYVTLRSDTNTMLFNSLY